METEIQRASNMKNANLTCRFSSSFDFFISIKMINIFHPQVIHCWVKQRAVPISSAEMLVLAPVIMTRHLLGLYKATITNINGHTSSLVLSSSFSQLLLFCSSQYSGSPLHSRLSSSLSSWLIFCFVTSSDCKTQLPQQHSPGLLPPSL